MGLGMRVYRVRWLAGIERSSSWLYTCPRACCAFAFTRIVPTLPWLSLFTHPHSSSSCDA